MWSHSKENKFLKIISSRLPGDHPLQSRRPLAPASWMAHARVAFYRADLRHYKCKANSILCLSLTCLSALSKSQKVKESMKYDQ